MKKADIDYFKDNKQAGSKGMVYYTNFVLSEESIKYSRIAYTYMEVIGDIGGLIEFVVLLVGFLLYPIYYNISGIKMLKEYVLDG